MLFVPTDSGTVADQFDVPLAGPDAPVELLQVTEVTPADAVPLTVIEAAVVDTIVTPGDVILSTGGAFVGVGVEGGVGFGLAGGVADGGVGLGVTAACRLTVITFDATPPAVSL